MEADEYDFDTAAPSSTHQTSNGAPEPEDAWLGLLRAGNEAMQNAHDDLKKIERYCIRADKYGTVEMRRLAASVWGRTTWKFACDAHNPDVFDQEHIVDKQSLYRKTEAYEDAIGLRIAYRSYHDLAKLMHEMHEFTFVLGEKMSDDDPDYDFRILGPDYKSPMDNEGLDLIATLDMPQKLRRIMYKGYLQISARGIDSCIKELNNFIHNLQPQIQELQDAQGLLPAQVYEDWLAQSQRGRHAMLTESISHFLKGAKTTKHHCDFTERLKRDKYPVEWKEFQALHSHELWVEFKKHWDMLVAIPERLKSVKARVWWELGELQD